MKGNVIQLNTLHLNSVRLNGIGKVQSVSLKGGSTEDPVFPPIEPEPTPTYTLSASVTNGMVSATRNGSAVNLPFTANEGDVIVLVVTPNDGYTFEGWNDGNTDNPRTITMNADVALSAQCVEVVQPPVGNYIQFEDKAVEAICVENWSSDGIGLTEEDAAAVTSIGTTFQGNTAITSFEELQYFTGLTSISTLYESGASQAAFYGCDKLKRITIPKNVTRLGSYSFYRCSALESVSFADKSKITDINSSAFGQCTSLAMEVDFPNLQELGNYAFDHCEKVSKVISLGKITIINGAPEVYNANSTFYGCKSLQAVSLPSTLTKMGNLVFVQCALSEVEIPADVTQMESYVFYQCASLSKAICRAATPPSVGTEIFKGTNSALVIYVPDASLEAYKTATNWNTYADRIHPLSEIEGSLVFYDKLVGDGVAYINTESYPTSWDNVEWDADAPSVYNKYIFGCKSSVLSVANLVYSATQTYYNYKPSTSATTINEDNAKRQRRTLRIVDLGNGSYRREVADLDSGVVNSIDAGWSGKDVVATNALRVFCSTTSAGANEKFYKGAIRSIIITDAKTGNTIMSLKPCTFAGEAGMWDEVNGKFYGNAAASGEFTAAND